MKKKIFTLLLSFVFLFSFQSLILAQTCKNQTSGTCPNPGDSCQYVPSGRYTGNYVCVASPGSPGSPNTVSGTPLPGTNIFGGGNTGGTSADVRCTPTGGTTDSGIKTAIGCVPILTPDNGTSFMGFILRWAVGVGGGIAFLLILYGGFMVMTSAGNPERLKAGQELLTSAISGLILLIFSVFILKFIGIDILGLGAFGFGK